MNTEDLQEIQREVFAHNLKIYMRDRNVSQKDLVRDLKLPSATVSSWVNGQRMPRMDKIQLLADYLEVSKSDLIEKVILGEFSSYREAKSFAKKLEDIAKRTRDKERLTPEEETFLDDLMKYVTSDKPPHPITAPRFATLENTTHDTINTNEQQARFEWINERLNCGKEITEDDEKFRREYMEQALRKIYADTARRILNAYNQLNQEGQLRAAEQVEMLTEIPKYRRKPDGQ